MSNAIVQVGPLGKLDTGKDLVRAMLGGNFGKEEIGLLASWAKGLNETIKSVCGQKKNCACVLIDIHEMGTYSEPQIITILTELMKNDNAYVYRTATVGGTFHHEMTESVLRSISDRENLKNFKTEDEAMNWLKE